MRELRVHTGGMVPLTQQLVLRSPLFQSTPLRLDPLPHPVPMPVVDAHFELEVRASTRGREARIGVCRVGEKVDEYVVCGEDGEFELCREEHGLELAIIGHRRVGRKASTAGHV